MAVKQTGRKQYKTMQGKPVDMDLLRQRNELTPAVGNARVNARGDELGAGGKIVRKREEVLKDYYRDHPSTVPDETPARVQEDQPAPVVDEAPKSRRTKAQEKVEKQWVEDADGNFVPKDE